jgi:integrase
MQVLSAIAVKQAACKDKPYKITDGGGLYVLVKTKGKYWRYNYRFAGKRKTLALGVYPDISLAEARKRHQKAREQLADGIDPMAARKSSNLQGTIAAGDTFEVVGEEWFDLKMLDKSKEHTERAKRMLKNDLYPVFGKRPIIQIKPTDVLSALRKIEARGVDASKTRSLVGQVFKYGIATGRCEFDPSRDLASALKSHPKKHYAAIIDPKEVAKLLIAINEYDGSAVVQTALQISALTFQRPGEIRHMEWSEIDWDKKQWEIPARKMKMKNDHIVPLATQTLDHLKELHKLTGNGMYVFPSARGGSRPLSDNGVRTALRTMGYDKETMTAHGFRAMARTILDEVLGFRVEWIEHQLAHAVRDANGRAYNRTSYLKDRVKMMQDWADYLDSLVSC